MIDNFFIDIDSLGIPLKRTLIEDITTVINSFDDKKEFTVSDVLIAVKRIRSWSKSSDRHLRTEIGKKLPMLCENRLIKVVGQHRVGLRIYSKVK